MINERGMKFLESGEGLDFYLYRPTVRRLYYDDGKEREWPVHQTALSHRLHLWLYMLLGGYRILYMTKDDDVVSYIVFTRGSRFVIRGSTRKDLYTIFIWTYPEYRRQGRAAALLREYLHGLDFEYETAYKTIVGSNTASVKAAEASGYRRLYPVRRTRVLHAARRAEDGDYFLYAYTNGSAV